jgi:hypothetical protein
MFMEKFELDPVELNDDELAAVAGGFSVTANGHELELYKLVQRLGQHNPHQQHDQQFYGKLTPARRPPGSSSAGPKEHHRNSLTPPVREFFFTNKKRRGGKPGLGCGIWFGPRLPIIAVAP